MPDYTYILKKILDAISAIVSGGTVVLGTFRATGSGTGYSIDDIIIYRQTLPDDPEYFNATTNLVIATPDPADLGSVSSASSVSVTSSALPTGASTAALQSSVQESAGADASKAIAIQGLTGGKSIPVTLGDALPTGSNTIGAIANTAFGITGTLPAFAVTPTVNIGAAPNLTFTNTAFTANAGTNLNTSLLALESGGNLAGINTKLPSGLTVSSNRLVVDGSGVTQPVSFTAPTPAFLFTSTITRAANVTAYTANDVYGAAFELVSSPAPTSGQWLLITDIEIIFNLTALPSGMAGFQLYTYGITPPSAVADNGAFSVPSGDRASIIYPNGLSLGSAALARGGGSVVAQVSNLNVAVKLAGTSLFAYLVTAAAFTPAANSETATIRVRAIAL